MARLDSNAAWKEASRLVGANRDVLVALAGVFFMLPSLALAVFMGEPEVVPGMKPDQMMAVMSDFYARGWWLILLNVALSFIGILATLTLMRDRSRPTVAEAIRAGAAGAPSYFASQALFGVGLGLVGAVLIAVGALISPVLGGVMVLFVFCGAVYFAFRLILVAPIVAVEGARNPVAAMRRSWQLTKGNFWRLFAFVMLVLVLFVILLSIVMLIVGIVLALATSGDTQRVLAAVVSSAVSSVAVVYFAGMIAAVHRQLGGPAREDLSATFE